MEGGVKRYSGVAAVLILTCLVLHAEASPFIDHTLYKSQKFPRSRNNQEIGDQSVFDMEYRICITNCAQCKKMYGPYFEGQMCADMCVKMKGKFIPDCEDLSTIMEFLSKYE